MMMKRCTTDRKILIVNTTPFGPGGIAKVIAFYYEKIYGGEFAFDIVGNNTQIPDEYIELFKKGNSKVYCVTRKKGVLRYIWKLFWICKSGHYDAIHVHGNSASMVVELLVAWMCGVKGRIAHCHTSKCEHQKMHRLLLPMFSRLYTKALACSKEAGEWIFGQNNFLILNNALDVQRYTFSQERRIQCRREFGIGEDEILFGHVGYFNETKNQEFLLEFMKKLIPHMKTKLLLVGDGKTRLKVEEKTKQLGLEDRVLFAGVRNDIAAILQGMDIFLFPSKWEGLGIALLEAQLTGMPCIASENVPKATNLAANVTYLPIDSVDDWVNCVLSLDRLNDVADRSSSSEATALEAEKRGFSLDAEANKLTKLYADCTKVKNKGV